MSARLSRRLVLQERTAAPDGAGGDAGVWTDRGVHWAAVEPRGARERVLAGREASFVTHRAKMRHFDPGDPARPRADQRFVDGDRVYAIRGVTELGDRRSHLICWLEEGASS